MVRCLLKEMFLLPPLLSMWSQMKINLVQSHKWKMRFSNKGRLSGKKVMFGSGKVRNEF